jgi:predicted nucleotide-binding protein
VSTESDLKRYRDEAGKIRLAISKASSEVATKRKKAATASGAAARSKNAITIRTKRAEAERAENDAIAAEKKRADLESKLAEVEKKVTTTQTRYEKEQQANQKKALDAIRRQNATAAAQFDPSRRLSDSGPSHPLLDRDPGSGMTAAILEPEYAVFLSHASEDKETIARPLKEALEARRVSVWFDEIKIKLGQSIRAEIEKGITHARFGVVILSPDFFAKQWTRAELDALFSRKMASGESITTPKTRYWPSRRSSLEFSPRTRPFTPSKTSPTRSLMPWAMTDLLDQASDLSLRCRRRSPSMRCRRDLRLPRDVTGGQPRRPAA